MEAPRGALRVEGLEHDHLIRGERGEVVPPVLGRGRGVETVVVADAAVDQEVVRDGVLRPIDAAHVAEGEVRRRRLLEVGDKTPEVEDDDAAEPAQLIVNEVTETTADEVDAPQSTSAESVEIDNASGDDDTETQD